MTCRDDSLRVGGEFELRPQELPAAAIGELPSLGGRSELWVDTGRSALLLAACDILQRGGAAHVWLPAYCCESVVQPFRAAGFATTFYPLDGRLQEGPERLPPVARGETFVYIHYFGHRNRVLHAHAQDLKRAGAWVIEDCVQAGLSAGVGRLGHHAVASYRKLLPQPDGAVLASDTALEAQLPEPDEQFISQRMLAQLLRATSDFDCVRPLLADSEGKLNRQIVPRRASWIASHLMQRADLPCIAQRRRANWQGLAARLASLIPVHLAPVFGQLQEGEVPLGFAVRIHAGRRDALRAYLAGHDAYCPVHWPLPHLASEPRFAADRALSGCMLTLPIDQRMTDVHVQRLGDLVQRFFREST